MVGDSSPLVSALHTEVGDGLRVIAEYDEEGYDLDYVREDVQPKVKERNVDRIHQELVLQGLSREHLEDLFDAGRLQCSVHRFDELTAIHFVQTETAGKYVSIDSDASVEFNSLVETCRQYF